QQQRLDRVEQELEVLNPEALQAELGLKQGEKQQSEARIQQLQAQLSEQQSSIGQRREQNHELSDQLDQARRQMQDLRGRNASLEALQQAALGKQQGAVNQWLVGRQLDQAPRLAQKLDVARGWERAVECVLGAHLEAVCVDGVDPVSAALESLNEGSLTLFDTTMATQQAMAPAGSNLLRDKITAPWSLEALLAGVHVAESLAEALAMRAQLAAHESVVTRDGIWLGSSWLRVVRDQDERAGVLQREQELKALASDIAQIGATIAASEQQLQTGREQLQTLERQRDQYQSELQQANRQHAEAQSTLSAVHTRLEQARSRHTQLSNEKHEAHQQTQHDTEELGKARGRLQDAIEKMSSLEQERETLSQQRDALRQQLESSRQQAQGDRQRAHDIALRAETLRTELTSTQQALTRMDNQIQQLSGRREELQSALSEGEAPIGQMSTELEALLAQRVKVENELNEVRTRVQALEHQMRELEGARNVAEEGVQIVRGELEQLRMAWQEIKVRRQTLDEQVRETGFQLRSLLDEMPEAANEETWAVNLEELEGKIHRLGAINLAAIDEFEQQSERKKYLDEQNADLMEALETLENAIRKIDKETRTRFQETYDKVNTGLQDLFPRMFGGGHAYLEMTSEDLLDTGITVMARPPGKRNSSIHLLSGGEKALTAVALVFSLFQLNPAPFCMLDEVDAPLDDANVGRYCDMLKHMSDKTQFIFITHNKVTMEAAKHLTGVTMNEPGVSRLVAVDIDEAAKLAAV
ncbi:MAG: chromosome segregation protein SMC, partial [Gammaproteobacteria bacterium]